MAHNFELIAKILRRYSFGDFFTWREKLVLFVFLRVGRYVPQLSVSMFLRQIHKDSQPMLLLLDSFDELESSAKSQHGFLCNFHFIAKSAFSNAIIEENLARVKGALDSPAVSHISIKGRAFYLLGTEFARMQDMLSSKCQAGMLAMDSRARLAGEISFGSLCKLPKYSQKNNSLKVLSSRDLSVLSHSCSQNPPKNPRE